MRKYISILLTSFLIVLSSCKDVEVYYPIPLQSQVPIIVTATGGTFNDSLQINTADISDDLVEKLYELGLTLDDVDKIVLEGAAYIVVESSESNVVMTDSINIRYGSSGYVNMMFLEQIEIDQIMNTPQTNVLSPEGVALFNTVLKDIKNNEAFPLVFIQSKGSLVPVSNQVIFKVLIDLTVTTVVKKIQTIFDPLG
ncbi:MAG: hypothetical protein A2Y94_15570 [Caldithrix sp. RBG_13_44_9]|nr:MAG: hypothetical protein A2Y94_15570 [Caldithrix sp. RBG_13_44_9]